MKILHIVPEFEEGGVERYVVQLCNEQVKRGHEITLATAGGKLEKLLPDKNVKVLVATNQTLGSGLTLTEATQVFFFGTPYRSVDFEQADGNKLESAAIKVQ